MTYRPESEKQGYTHVLFRDGSTVKLRRNEFEPMCEALKRGDEWYEGLGLFGSLDFIRLSTVAKIGEATPESIVVYDAECEDEAAYKKAHGED